MWVALDVPPGDPVSRFLAVEPQGSVFRGRAMPAARVQFTMWGMMIAIAILALSMGGGIVVALLLIQALRVYRSRRSVQELAGGIRLRAVLPSPSRLLWAGVVIYAVLLTGSFGYIVLIAIPAGAGMLLSEILLFVYGWVGILYWTCLSWTCVEFRENGVVHGHHYWPWESIWMWGWTDRAYGFWLKVPFRFDEYGIAREDKEAIQAILEEYLGRMKQRPADFATPVPNLGQ